MKKTTLKDIFVIIVIYKEEYFLTKSYVSLLKSYLNFNNQSRLDICIYDNSPEPTNKSKNELNIKVHYIHNPLNPGVGKAYNEGVLLAKKLDKKYILLLDQDSQLKNDFLQKMIFEINKQPQLNIFAPIVISKITGEVLSPKEYNYNFFNSKKIDFNLNIKEIATKKYSIINSGMIIKVNLFNQVGGYNENILLDFSDHEFISRLSKFIEKISLLDTKIIHELSCQVNTTLSSRLFRYKTYLIGGKEFSKTINKRFSFYLVSFARGVKLSIKNKSFYYISIWFKQMVCNLLRKN